MKKNWTQNIIPGDSFNAFLKFSTTSQTLLGLERGGKLACECPDIAKEIHSNDVKQDPNDRIETKTRNFHRSKFYFERIKG